MKKRYLAFIVLLISFGILNVKALVIDDCKVLASYKLYSSLDEENYICKGKEYGSSTDSIYYSGEGEDIYLKNFEGYYFSNYNESINLKLSGESNIFLIHLSDTKIKVSGNGSLKFKENSFVKKVVNGEAVYRYLYNDKLILDSDKKIYEGIEKEFEDNYDNFKTNNNLPEKYNKEDYTLIQAVDYSKMVSVPVTDSWLSSHIETNLSVSTVDGFGIVKYVKETKKTEKKNETKLESENVILISNEKVDEKYKLNEKDLKDEEIGNKIDNSIDESLISLYDVTVINGNKEVSMKDGSYTIKIKLDDTKDLYENYRIIYVNDDGEIEEYIDGVIEGDYIVFETSHLSQYGVIGSRVDNVSIKKSNTKHIIGIILKISIICGFMAISSIIISFLLGKSNIIKTKKSKKRRA